jgi:hypothetical protein
MRSHADVEAIIPIQISIYFFLRSLLNFSSHTGEVKTFVFCLPMRVGKSDLNLFHGDGAILTVNFYLQGIATSTEDVYGIIRAYTN